MAGAATPTASPSAKAARSGAVEAKSAHPTHALINPCPAFLWAHRRREAALAPKLLAKPPSRIRGIRDDDLGLASSRRFDADADRSRRHGDGAGSSPWHLGGRRRRVFLDAAQLQGRPWPQLGVGQRRRTRAASQSGPATGAAGLSLRRDAGAPTSRGVPCGVPARVGAMTRRRLGHRLENLKVRSRPTASRRS